MAALSWLDKFFVALLVKNKGTTLTQRPEIDFVGDGVDAADVPGEDLTRVTIPGNFLARNVIATGVLTAGAQSNKAVYDVPAAPSGNGRAIVTGVILRLKTALVGAGRNDLTVGTANGGTQFMLTKQIVAGTTVGTIYGLTLADLGASFASADGYNASLAASASVIVSMAVNSTVTVAPVFEVDVLGWTVGT